MELIGVIGNKKIKVEFTKLEIAQSVLDETRFNESLLQECVIKGIKSSAPHISLDGSTEVSFVYNSKYLLEPIPLKARISVGKNNTLLVENVRS